MSRWCFLRIPNGRFRNFSLLSPLALAACSRQPWMIASARPLRSFVYWTSLASLSVPKCSQNPLDPSTRNWSFGLSSWLVNSGTLSR